MSPDSLKFMYGTAWKEDATARLTRQAIEVGFRAIDTANQRKHYYEAGVGEALAECYRTIPGLTRADLFLQTKFTYARGQDQRLPYDPRATPAEQVRQSFQSSLAHLGTDYLDSYVLHGPDSSRGLSALDRATWAEMEAHAHAQKTRALGISNVSAAQLDALLGFATIRPRFVQNRCYARHAWDREVRAICKSAGIIYQGFSLLTANPDFVGHASVQKIARKRGWQATQVVFRFAIDLGMLPLTGSSDAEHLREDLAVVDAPLDRDELASLSAI